MDGLCVRCALCCDGTLFRLTVLTPPEAEAVRAVGLPVLQAGGYSHLAQPCAGLEGTLCSLYTDRPAICRAYRCGLLRAVEQGELAEGEALALLLAARGAAAQLIRSGGAGPGRAALAEACRQILSEAPRAPDGRASGC